MSTDMKVCRQCAEPRALSDYYVARGYIGLTCKVCIAANKRQGARAAAIRRRRGRRATPRLDPNGMTQTERYAFLQQVRALNECKDCGSRERLEFDHLPQYEKLFTISVAGRATGSWTDADVVAEIAKCEMVCRSCHRERTGRRMRTSSTWEEHQPPLMPSGGGAEGEGAA